MTKIIVVIPAKAGIHFALQVNVNMDSRFRWNDAILF